MTNIANTPVYDKKTLRNLLLQNQFADGIETWYVASGAQVLLRVFRL